ncbi:MAG: extracellular solute-binding protein [Desulfovibrio sp.]|uniref:extracellular solute-binding protein n=1 Tax=Desulfovibrio sp. 7SRBS1 TaxID=3378064 RepID=UPI003B419568
MRCKGFLSIFLSAAVMLLSASAVMAQTTLNALFMSQAAYSEDNVKAMTADFEAANPGIKVNTEFVPYEALHDKIVAAKGAGDRGYDVVLFDVVWPAEFAKRGFLVDVTDRIDPSLQNQIFDGAWTTVTYNDHKYGMPWILDTKYLFYNKEMLKKAGFDTPPATWSELLKQAKVIKDKGLAEFPIVWSWGQAEAVICDYTTLVGAYAGKFYDNGKPVFNQGGALDAVKFMVDSLDKGLTNPSSREYLEEDVRRVFSNGEAAFALNWTYMFALANDPKESKIAGKAGVAPAPGVEGKTKASAVNGSMGLGIPGNSAHKDEAWKYITYLTSQKVQNKYARLSLPIWKSSYSDPAVTNGQESLVAAADKALSVMYPRPAVPFYTELSNILQRYIHEALLGKSTPAEAMDNAVQRARRLR